MNALQKWLDDTGLTKAEFGARCGCSEATISRLTRGIGNVSKELAQAVYRETGGAITPNHLMDIGLSVDEDKAA